SSTPLEKEDGGEKNTVSNNFEMVLFVCGIIVYDRVNRILS
mgnify:CR=1